MAGMGLLDLIIAMSIAIMTILVGVPAFKSGMARNRVVTYANDFMTALYLARSTAITQGRPVALCKSNNGVQCATSGDWTQGWITFIDRDNTATVTSGDTVLRVHSALEGDNTLSGNQYVSTYVSYSSDGYTRTVNGAFQAGTLSFSLCDGNKRSTIVISSSGRPRVAKVNCS
jgi:type IV fimbrial biogenesis protein FimT